MSHLAMLQTQLQSNTEFRQKLLSFLEHIIKCSASQNLHLQTLDQACPNANDPITTPEFTDLLRLDSEVVARKVQMHLPSQNSTYYKYNTRKSKVCKFDFPRPSLPNSEININGTIRLKRDNIWVNPWNPAIASLIQSNHDINFILSSIKALALIYYIKNYATKDDCSHYQRVIIAAIMRKAFDDHDNNITTGLSNYTPTLDKFALKAFN